MNIAKYAHIDDFESPFMGMEGKFMKQLGEKKEESHKVIADGEGVYGE